MFALTNLITNCVCTAGTNTISAIDEENYYLWAHYMNISCKILINILKRGQIDGKLTEIDNRHTNINAKTCKSWNIRISSGFTTKRI